MSVEARSLYREAWLAELAKAVTPLFKGFQLPPYRLTCGWPCKNALSKRQLRLGECHSHRSSKGGVFEIFITPLKENSLEVAGIACHELVHVAAGTDAGHGKGFVKVARHIGLTKNKPTQAMPSALLEEKLLKIIDKLGTYPHQAIQPQAKEIVKEKSSFTLVCPGCGCKCTMSAKWLTEAGPTTCYCGMVMEIQV